MYRAVDRVFIKYRIVVKMHTIKSKIFKKMFSSYLIIIILCFAAYSAVVVYEAVTVKKEQTEQFYKTKVSSAANAVDLQIYNAENIVSNINSSSLINKFYLDIMLDRTVDSYLLYQIINDIKYQKTSVANLNIYEIALIIDNYNKVYTSSEVIALNEYIEIPKDAGIYFGTANLNSLLNITNNQLLLYKDYLIYTDTYKYLSGSVRGEICILFEKERIRSLMNKILGSNVDWAIMMDGEPVFSSKVQLLKENTGHTFTAESDANDRLSYVIWVDQTEFKLKKDSAWTFALIIGALVCIFYIVLAFFMAYKYYKPFNQIGKMIGNEEKQENNQIYDIVAGVEQLVGERNGYMEKVVTITPYVEQGVLHSVFLGNLDRENLNTLCTKELLNLQKTFFIAAVVNIGYEGEESLDASYIKEFKNKIADRVRLMSKDKMQIVYYDWDLLNLYFIFNSNNGEIMEDFLYEFFSTICSENEDKSYMLTMGAADVIDEPSELKTASGHARAALSRILTQGRGGVWFYEENISNEYYFPKDSIKRIAKAVKNNNRKDIHEWLTEIRAVNIEKFDLSLDAIELLLNELYAVAIKAVQTVSAGSNIQIRIEKIESPSTFNEIIKYYETVFEMVIKQLENNMINNENVDERDKQIIDYVDKNYRRSDISLTHISDKFGVNGKYITYLFKESFGITYLQYVQEKRIAFAMKLIKDSEYSLETIATECGYTNLLTFRRNFKAIMNMNPSDIREKEQKNR